MKKWSSKLESTQKKLSKIGPVGNFDFWSKVNAKSQSQSQLVRVGSGFPGQSQRILVRVSSGFPGRVTGRTVDPMTSSYDVSLTWLMTCLGLTWTCLRGCWRGLMTSSDDVR